MSLCLGCLADVPFLLHIVRAARVSSLLSLLPHPSSSIVRSLSVGLCGTANPGYQNPNPDQWHHWTWVYTAATGVTGLYLNGLFQTNATLGGATSFTPTYAWINSFGRSPPGGGVSNGEDFYIDQLRVWSRLLNPNEIIVNMADGDTPTIVNALTLNLDGTVARTSPALSFRDSIQRNNATLEAGVASQTAYLIIPQFPPLTYNDYTPAESYAGPSTAGWVQLSVAPPAGCTGTLTPSSGLGTLSFLTNPSGCPMSSSTFGCNIQISSAQTTLSVAQIDFTVTLTGACTALYDVQLPLPSTHVAIPPPPASIANFATLNRAEYSNGHLTFDGTTNIVAVAASFAVPYSVCSWTYLTSYAAGNRAFISFGPNTAHQGFAMGYNGAQQTFHMWTSDDTVGPATGWGSSELSVWHLLCGTFDTTSNLRRIYRDGVQVFSGTPSNGFVVNPPPTWTIGVGPGATSAFWAGYLDEVTVWTSLLSPSDIASLYVSSNPIQSASLRFLYSAGYGLVLNSLPDLSGNQVVATPSGGGGIYYSASSVHTLPSCGSEAAAQAGFVSSHYDGGMYFSGSNSFLKIDTATAFGAGSWASNPFTVSFWGRRQRNSAVEYGNAPLLPPPLSVCVAPLPICVVMCCADSHLHGTRKREPG